MTSERSITLALIGRGKWGQNYINTINSGIPGIKLPSKNIFGRDYKEHLHDLSAEEVIVASTTNTHFEVSLSLLEAGFLKLLIEKPVTQTLSEALELQDKAEALRALIMVGHIQLYDPAYQEMLNKRKLVGEISQINFKGLKSNIREGVTTLQEWGPHPIYMCLDLLGRNPTSVSAILPKNSSEDNIILTLDFDQVQATAEIGYNYPDKRREFTVTGDNGSLTLDWGGREKTLIYYKSDQPPQKLAFSTMDSPLKLEVLEFVRYIKGQIKPKSPLSQGVEVMRIIDLAEKSLEQKGKLLPLS